MTIEDHYPTLTALVGMLQLLDGSHVEAPNTARAGARIAEALKAHEKRGGAVPWK